ncbi:hypothetical protein BS78_07G083300 [Paspalum vaginatum]|nr:hypothetical protein BS78_07G083300 [Paspalum vaginatum]
MSTDCPPWIDPGNAFRIHIKCGRYKANLEYGQLEMQDSEHDLWIDTRTGYSLDTFVEDMAALIIWGSSQQVEVWGVDTDSGSEWKVRGNDQFRQMIEARLDEKGMTLAVDVIDKAWDCTRNSLDVGPHGVDGLIVDRDTLVIETDNRQDGDANKLVDESALYQALGFEANDEEAAAKAQEEYAIPCMPPYLEEEFREVAIPVDDIENTEALVDWDRDNPDMTVGVVYPSMRDFRLAVRQEVRS